MKTSFDHLPEEKRKEIYNIVDIIKEYAKPEKIILFGSHAKGRWVEDEYVENGVRYSYNSDYDFLIVINNNNKKDYEVISNIENKCLRYKNPVNIIVHSLDHVNKGLKIGQYFFTDIIKEGILLFDSGDDSFVEAKELTDKERKERAKGYFDMWFPQGSEFLIDANNAFNRDNLRLSLFYLHQSTECFYSTVLLISTGYKPKTHNLQKLRNYSKHISQDLYDIFPRYNEMEYHLFETLKSGYVDARYKLDFVINKEEIKELFNRIILMKNIVLKIYQEKILL